MPSGPHDQQLSFVAVYATVDVSDTHYGANTKVGLNTEFSKSHWSLSDINEQGILIESNEVELTSYLVSTVDATLQIKPSFSAP